jgi:hypothetical protein
MDEFQDQPSVEAELSFSPFIGLLADAITFSHLAENPSLTRLAKSALIRASILNTVFALECVANLLLSELDLSKHVYAQFERLPILDKYETLLLFISPAHTFDRGKKEVQAIKELIDLRNKQVHVRVTHQKLIGQAINKVWWSFEPVENSFTKNLKIPFNIDQWESSHSVEALQALDKFLKLYLLDWAHFEPKYVAQILLSFTAIGQNAITLMPEEIPNILNLARARMGLKLEYIDLDAPNVRVSVTPKEIGDMLVHGRDTEE